MLLNIWYQTKFRFSIESNHSTSMVVKKYIPKSSDNFALFSKYNLLVINLVSRVAITAIIKNIILVLVHNTAIDNPNNNGLNVQNTENQITCLNTVITSAATVRVSNNHIKLIGTQLAIKLSIK